jgi:hypothetical protein
MLGKPAGCNRVAKIQDIRAISTFEEIAERLWL